MKAPKVIKKALKHLTRDVKEQKKGIREDVQLKKALRHSKGRGK